MRATKVFTEDSRLMGRLGNYGGHDPVETADHDWGLTIDVPDLSQRTGIRSDKAFSLV